MLDFLNHGLFLAFVTFILGLITTDILYWFPRYRKRHNIERIIYALEDGTHSVPQSSDIEEFKDHYLITKSDDVNKFEYVRKDRVVMITKKPKRPRK